MAPPIPNTHNSLGNSQATLHRAVGSSRDFLGSGQISTGSQGSHSLPLEYPQHPQDGLGAPRVISVLWGFLGVSPPFSQDSLPAHPNPCGSKSSQNPFLKIPLKIPKLPKIPLKIPFKIPKIPLELPKIRGSSVLWAGLNFGISFHSPTQGSLEIHGISGDSGIAAVPWAGFGIFFLFLVVPGIPEGLGFSSLSLGSQLTWKPQIFIPPIPAGILGITPCIPLFPGIKWRIKVRSCEMNPKLSLRPRFLSHSGKNLRESSCSPQRPWLPFPFP